MAQRFGQRRRWLRSRRTDTKVLTLPGEAVFVSLCLVIIVLIVTAGLKQPAMRIVHFLAYVSALPTSVTAVSLAIMLALF